MAQENLSDKYDAAKSVAAHGRSFGAGQAGTAGLSRFKSCAALHGGFDAHRNTSEQTMTAGKTARRVVPGGYMAM